MLPLLLRRVGARPAGRRFFSTKYEESKAKSTYEHMMEYKMPASLGVACLLAVSVRRQIRQAQEARDAKQTK